MVVIQVSLAYQLQLVVDGAELTPMVIESTVMLVDQEVEQVILELAVMALAHKVTRAEMDGHLHQQQAVEVVQEQ